MKDLRCDMMLTDFKKVVRSNFIADLAARLMMQVCCLAGALALLVLVL
jgi:hypothetical protein